MNSSADWLRDHRWIGRVKMVPSAVSLTDNGPLVYDDIWLIRPSYVGGRG